MKAKNDDLNAALRLLKEFVRDVECYCADNVAAKGPCPVHEAQSLIAGTERCREQAASTNPFFFTRKEARRYAKQMEGRANR